ncbi:MAG TPA: FtsX-like permease family protein [Candidatus Limiplasma sp.]|nr:FtsX-like permease family protein [Candidatus Limiplasma sp.]HPS81873.1 FtsX-like permease family protein [Candidatus Limiplasma sp.]
MTKLLYFRLALNNLWKNRQTYLPFLLASTLLTFAMYSFLMITFNPGLAKVHGGIQFMTILTLGIVVIGLFTAIFLFYANSFLIKRRKKEMGLYSILGMEKKHIARVLFHELSLTWLLSMLLGLGLGILLGRLMFLLIRLAMRIDVPLVGSVSVTGLLGTLGLFALLFLLLILYNTVQVRSVDPITLLRGGQTGEREPKARWILAVLGVVCMGGGYWMAQMVQNPMAAIALFLVAVLLVIVGTYLLFLSGSIALLKILKRNRRYYYQPRHFVTVSGMLYRMKQNAAGLASIAILCTMAMITIGTTVALYNGSEKMLSEYYPSDMQITMSDAASQEAVATRNAELSAQSGVTVTDFYAFTGYEVVFAMDQGKVFSEDRLQYDNINAYGMLHDVLMMDEATYTQLEGETLNLAPNEIGIQTSAKDVEDEMILGDATYALRKIDRLKVTPCLSHGATINRTYLVLPDDALVSAIFDASGTAEADRQPVFTTQWNVLGEQAAQDRYYALVNDQTPEWDGHNLRVKASLRGEWYGMHGGFLFVGIFLGSIFLMGTALIIYFKQISEGYQDHDRFIILQKVGMSGDEVHATVRRQILLVFFLPLAVAVCHVAGSLHMMVLLLQLFGLMDVPYIALNTFISAFGVVALYGLFYHKTAKTYYRMVKF